MINEQIYKRYEEDLKLIGETGCDKHSYIERYLSEIFTQFYHGEQVNRKDDCILIREIIPLYELRKNTETVFDNFIKCVNQAIDETNTLIFSLNSVIDLHTERIFLDVLLVK